ncbi:MAG: amidohydrolase family protein [Sphingomonadales bacterium]
MFKKTFYYLITLLTYLSFNQLAFAADELNYPRGLQDIIIQGENSWLLENVRVIDGTGAPAKDAHDILITSGKIAGIGPTGTLSVPVGTPKVAGDGKSVMPGLIMVHEHLFYNDHGAAMPNYVGEAVTFSGLYLSHGVTTMRTGGTMNITDDLTIKNRINEGSYPGPEVFLTAPYIDGPGSFASQLRVFDSEEKVRTMVRYWGSEGVKWLKAYMFVKPNILAAAIDEAHSLDMQVTGHLCTVTFGEAIDSGIDNLEHGFSHATELAEGKEFGKCPNGQARGAGLKIASENPELTQPLYDKVIKNNVYITSTLGVMAAGLRDYEPSPLALELMNSHARDNADNLQKVFAENEEARMGREASLQVYMKLEKDFHDAGGQLVLGTDPTGWGGTIPGPGNLSNLYLLKEAGVSPMDIITIATQNGSKMLKVDDRTGILKAGMEADMIIIDGNPDQDIHDIGNISMVITDGYGIDGLALANKYIKRVGR